MATISGYWDILCKENTMTIMLHFKMIIIYVQCNSSKVRPIKELPRARKCLVSWIQCYLNTCCVQKKYNDNNASFKDDNNIVQCNSSKVRPIKELPRAIKCLSSWRQCYLNTTQRLCACKHFLS